MGLVSTWWWSLFEKCFLITLFYETAPANLRHSFVLVCMNRFNQVITLHTFQAASGSAKVGLSSSSSMFQFQLIMFSTLSRTFGSLSFATLVIVGSELCRAVCSVIRRHMHNNNNNNIRAARMLLRVPQT